MRRPKLALTLADGIDMLKHAPYVHFAWSDSDGQMCLRAMHTAVYEDLLIFHGGKTGEKSDIVGRPVVAQFQEVLAVIPSYFTDPERACPATTFYRSVQAKGVVESIEDPAIKAGALSALMVQFQPEGGYVAIDSQDPRYRKAVATVQVWALPLDQISAKANLGQGKPVAVRTKIVQGLWARAADRDLETIEHMRAATALDPAPAAFIGTNECTLHAWAPPEDAAIVARHLAPAYWNEGTSVEQITQAHLASDAWVVARAPDGTIVGTARAISDDAKHAWVYDVWTAPEFRNRGLATALLRLLVDHGRVRNTRRQHLCTKDAQPLYRKLGFEEGRVSRHPYMVRQAVPAAG